MPLPFERKEPPVFTQWAIAGGSILSGRWAGGLIYPLRSVNLIATYDFFKAWLRTLAEGHSIDWPPP